jgi:hypothetical protein
VRQEWLSITAMTQPRKELRIVTGKGPEQKSQSCTRPCRWDGEFSEYE